MISDTMKLSSPSITIDPPKAPSHWHKRFNGLFRRNVFLEAHKRTEYAGKVRKCPTQTPHVVAHTMWHESAGNGPMDGRKKGWTHV
jgi:hypothetical protein